MIRFLHTGDLHLCSAFSAFGTGAAMRRERQFAALERLFEDALSAGAQFVLMAGDVFDTLSPDREAVRRLMAMLGALPVPALIAPGNHDYYRPGGLWDLAFLPDNVTIFKENALAARPISGLPVTVWGYAFTEEACPSPVLGRAADREEGQTHILLAHADLISPLSSYAPISAGQLEVTGFAYAALGHIHKPTKPRRCGHTMAAYCGFFAGRGFDEPGAGGANLVEIDGREVKIGRILSVADRFEILPMDLTGAMGGEEVRTRVRDGLAAENLPKETALRVILRGEVGADCHPDAAALSRLGESFALFEVRDETLPVFNAAYLEKDPGMRGAFYRAMLPRLHSTDEKERVLAAQALRFGFAALSGREV